MTPPLTPEELASLAAQHPGAARTAVLHALERSLARGPLADGERSARLRSVARALLDTHTKPHASEDALAPLDAQIEAVYRALETVQAGPDDAPTSSALVDRLTSLEERYAEEMSRRFTARRPLDPDAAARAMRNAGALLAKYAGAPSDDPAGE
jgi:hypothetical protein